MKTLGLVGGLTSESTAVYYHLLNHEVKDRIGKNTSSQLLLWSFDLASVLPLYLDNKPGYIDAIANAGVMLRDAGVDGLMILSNSAHMGAQKLGKITGLPVIHMLDVIAAELKISGYKKPLVLGTDFVMESDFYIPGLCERVDIDPIVPDAANRKILNDILFAELAHGSVRDESRDKYLDVINIAEEQGADCVVLGCTEHGMLLDQSHHHLPMLDSTQLHVKAAVDFQLS